MFAPKDVPAQGTAKSEGAGQGSGVPSAALRTPSGRPQSRFDGRAVFTACPEAGTALEINCRHERGSHQSSRPPSTAAATRGRLRGGEAGSRDGVQPSPSDRRLERSRLRARPPGRRTRASML
ncbi:hypothetical protein GCM10010430_77170 [Kitasatospora cystarginea]|uniref:Uncharacterized protein n=1 Tax=Kitasatospora cystarginea TaxID=58350 RepID=A0ABP5RX20_9ACTN